MTKLKLTYFDMDGGRGEPARLAMHIGDIPFEDERLSFPEFAQARDSFPFKRVPVLGIDELRVTHSNGINRYVGKLAGLYPDDALQAARCDEVMGAVEDILHLLVPTFLMEDETEKKRIREALAEGPITDYLTQLQNILKAQGGSYFADNRLTVADLKVMVWIRSLRSGNMDFIPEDIVDKVAPDLAHHQERIEQEPKVQSYYASRA